MTNYNRSKKNKSLGTLAITSGSITIFANKYKLEKGGYSKPSCFSYKVPNGIYNYMNVLMIVTRIVLIMSFIGCKMRILLK